MRCRHADGRCVDGRLAVERRDQPRGSSCAPHPRHLVVSAVNLLEVPFQDMGLRVQEGLVGNRTEDEQAELDGDIRREADHGGVC